METTIKKQEIVKAKSNAVVPVKQKLIITREFDANRELVWKAWTDPAMYMKWCGPKNYTCPSCEIDFRVGGKYLYCMRSPEGKDFWGTGTYKEIIPMKRIVCTDSFADEKGNVVSATHYGMEGFPLELQVTVTFEEHNGKTKMTLTHIGIPSGQMTDLTNAGWNESFDKLAESLKGIMGGNNTKTKITAEPGKQELFITREFDAARELVFKAFTNPELYAQWIGPRELTTTIKTFEPRSGGKWRYISKDKDGNKYAFHGVFHEVSAPEIIIETFEFEGLPEAGHVILETARFESLPDNRTKLTCQSVFQSVADRDGMLQSGMEKGVNEGYEKLDELLAKELAK